MFKTTLGSKLEGGLAPPILKEYWPFHPEWLEYVKRNWNGSGRVQKDYSDGLIEFRERARMAFEGKRIPVKHVKSFISLQIPKKGEGYDDNYPHVHYPLTATTLIHYLQPGDKPAPLDIFHEDEVVETIYPEQGLTVFVPNHVKHGVRINQGTIPRIQLIATAL